MSDTKKVKTVWLYTRLRSTDAQLELQRTALLQTAAQQGWRVVGISTDDADDWLLFRPGLSSAIKAVRQDRADAVMVCRLENISHSASRREAFIHRLERSGGVLLVNEISYKGEIK